MAGVLPQTNACLLEVLAAPLLGDSFQGDSFGSGSGESSPPSSKWNGRAGVWITNPRIRRESSTDGRDVVSDRRIFVPLVCSISVGDSLRLELDDGSEETVRVAEVSRQGRGVELRSSQVYELQIEVL